MTESMPAGKGFVATTSPRRLSIPLMFVGLVAAIAAVIALVSAVRLFVVDDKFEPTVMLVGGLLIALGGFVAFRRLNVAETYELHVSDAGLELIHGAERRSWSWDEVSEIRVLGGAIRRLSIEDQRAELLKTRAPRLHDAARTLGQHTTVGNLVPLTGMQPDEFAILNAIRECSGGRFPQG